jgi:hypothetical protein
MQAAVLFWALPPADIRPVTLPACGRDVLNQTAWSFARTRKKMKSGLK